MSSPERMPAATTGIGSLPHHNIDSALAFSLRHEIPFLPQIPIRNPWEFMIAQALEDLPGLSVERDGEVSLNPEIWASRASQLEARLERAFREGPPGSGGDPEAFFDAFSEFEPSAAVSSSWQAFLWELREGGHKLAKVQIAGPMTCQWALRLTGGSSLDKSPDIASQIFRLVLARSLAMCRRLRASGIAPILFLDEPGLYAYSASNPRHVLAFQELKLLVQTLRKEDVSVGLHCCSNTDWKSVLGMELSYLSLDTALSLDGLLGGARAELVAYVGRGGRFSFGVIPTGRSSAVHSQIHPTAHATAFEDLRTKLHAALGSDQAARKVLLEALYTPACGLALQSVADAELIADALRGFARQVRESEARGAGPLMLGLRKEDFEDLPPEPEAGESAQGLAAPGPRVSLLIPAREATHALERTLRLAHAFLSRRHGADFEIILIPNPPPGVARDASIHLSEELGARFSQVRVVPHLAPPLRPGKGAALRTGFLASKGRIVLFTDADLPYDLEFFDEALRRLEQGYDLVTANRRVAESRFDIPTALLPLAYGRHRLGLLFNRFVRLLFPVGTTDTQAGIKAMSRRLAGLAFARMRCPGFFFDLEIFLACRGQGWAHAEAPITLRLNTEKSTVRVLRESVLAIYWLARVWRGYVSGHYGKAPRRTGVLRWYRKLNPGTRLFLTLRWWLTPYARMAAQLPRKGLIYDLGCGHGLFSLALAREAPERKVVGLDHDEARIAIAREAARRASGALPEIRFESGDLFGAPVGGPAGAANAISMIDVLHYFDFAAQQSCLNRAHELLSADGTLIFREVDPEGGWISRWNRWYEKLATSIGFTRSQEESLFFRTKEEWLDALTEAGFRPRVERCSHWLFADVLYIAEKSPLAESGVS